MTDVADNTAEHHFEIRVEGQLAGFIVYEAGPDPDQLAFVHTEIDPAFEGQGLGSKLAGAALDTVAARGQSVLPRCDFVRGFIARKPQYLELVPADRRAEFGLPAPAGSGA